MGHAPRARWSVLGALSLALAVAACRGDGRAHGALPDAGPEAQEDAMILDLTPRPDQGTLEVEVRVQGARAEAIQALQVTRAWAGTSGLAAIRDVEVRDARGDVPRGGIEDEAATRVIRLGRTPSRALSIRYAVRGVPLDARRAADDAGREASRLGVRVGRGRVTGVGHAFLMLPRLDAPLRTRIRWHLEALGPDATAASSFGAGDVALEATSDALAHALYAAGPIQEIGGGAIRAAARRAPADPARAGASRLRAMGVRGLDPAAVLSWAGAVRGLADAALGGEAAGEPLTIFLIGEPGAGREHDGAYLDRALGLWLDQDRPFDAQLKIALAHELLHRLLGRAARVEDGAGRDAAWFSEGFTVHYARRLLFDAGLISGEDFLDDVRRTLDEGERAAGADPALAAHAARREAYRIGSLYAAHLDREIRRASRGARSLDDLLRPLVRSAAAIGPPDFRAAVAAELGPREAERFDRVVMRREEVVAPAADTFGPCFRQVRERVTAVDLGFDPASLEGTPRVLRGVVKGSAAHRAGLRDGALVLVVKRIPRAGEDQATARVDLTVADRRGGKRIRYRPVATREVTRWETRRCTTNRADPAPKQR